MKVNKNLVMGVLIAIVACGAGFFGGVQFRNSQLAQTRMSFAGGNFQRGIAGGRMGMGRGMGGAVIGSIISEDDKSITVKLVDGSTKIVLLTDSTTYSNTVAGAKSDLKVNGTVAVFGATNSDGSVTATTVNLNPMFRINPSPTPSSK